LGVSLEEAKLIDSKYKQMIPESRTFLTTAERVAKSRGYVMSMLGRRRRFKNSSYAHKAGNAVIQMTSADITKLKMVEVGELFMNESKADLLLQIHDELDWQTDITSKEGRELEREARSVMQSFGENDLITINKVPMTVDSDIGRNWGEATFGK
jgi:DNA polymerase-1